MRHQLIFIFLLLLLSSILRAQKGINIRTLKPAQGEGYIPYTDTNGRQTYVLFSTLVDDSTGLDVQVNAVSFDTSNNELKLYLNNGDSLQVTISSLTQTEVTSSKNQLFALSPKLNVSGDTIGVIYMLSESGGQLYHIEGYGIKIKTDGITTEYLIDTAILDLKYLLSKDSLYYLNRLDSAFFDTSTGIMKLFLTEGDSILANMDGRYLQEYHLTGIRDTLSDLTDSILVHRDSIDHLHTRIKELEGQTDSDNQTLGFVLPTLSISGGNGISLSALREWSNIINKPSTFPSAPHNHVEDDITDLDHFTGADITGNEAAFSGWDKNASDDFTGNYNDLTNKPSLFSGSWNNLTNIPSGFADNVDNNDNNYVSNVSFGSNTLTFTNIGLAFGNTVSLAGIQPTWSNILSKPSVFPPSSHTHTESEITDLDHYTDADIGGDEAAFDGWDKNVSDDFSGVYADLTGKPSLFSGAWADLTGIPTGFADNIDNDNISYVSGVSFLNNNLTFSRVGSAFGNTVSLASIKPTWTNVTGKPLTFTPSSHTHLEAHITDLDHFTGSDITGNETAFNGWDKSSSDDFSGNYNDLSNKPSLFSGSWNDLSNKPAGFADNIDNNNYPTSVTVTGTNTKTITINRSGETPITASFTDLTGSGGDGNNYPTSFTTISNNILTLNRNELSPITTDLSSLQANWNLVFNKPSTFASNWNTMSNIPNGFADGVDNEGGISIGYQDVLNGADPSIASLTNIDELHISIQNNASSSTESQLFFPAPSSALRGKKVYITSYNTNGATTRITSASSSNIMYKGNTGSVQITDNSPAIVICTKYAAGSTTYYWQVILSN